MAKLAGHNRGAMWLCAAALLLAVQAEAAAAPVLERVVMVSRHGIRSPLRSVAILQALTKRGWPAWPVGPGEMTEHGAKNLALMGEYLRGVYVRAGALPATACPAPGTVAVWSDVADRRTRLSGEILADRLAPGCGVAAPHAADGAVDPLFDATKSNACPVGVFATGRALLAATRDDGGPVRPEDRRSLEALQSILAPDACTGGAGVCLVPAPDASTLTAAAQLALGATVAEGLYLEYAQGFAPDTIGWGKAVGPDAIAAIIPVHDRGLDIRRRTSVLAARRGALMARTILALLKGEPLPPGAPPLPRDARLIMIAGHDSNLLYMGSLMGVDWRLPNQPSATAPDTTLAFEVWRDGASGARTVRAIIYAQTLEQLRNATPLDGAHQPDAVPLVPDACAKAPGICTLATFTTEVERDLAAICGG